MVKRPLDGKTENIIVHLFFLKTFPRYLLHVCQTNRAKLLWSICKTSLEVTHTDYLTSWRLGKLRHKDIAENFVIKTLS